MVDTINTHDVGDRVILRAELSVGGTLRDPDTITFRVRAAGQLATDYTATVSGGVVTQTGDRVTRLSAGVYTCWVEPDRDGDWFWKVFGTGGAKGAEEHQFRVRVSHL